VRSDGHGDGLGDQHDADDDPVDDNDLDDDHLDRPVGHVELAELVRSIGLDRRLRFVRLGLRRRHPKPAERRPRLDNHDDLGQSDGHDNHAGRVRSDKHDRHVRPERHDHQRDDDDHRRGSEHRAEHEHKQNDDHE